MPAQHDHHLIPWLKAKFNIEIGHCGTEYYACYGEYDLDVKFCTGNTRFGAALEFTACYNGAMNDKLVELEVG